MTARQRWTLIAAILASGIVFLDSTVVTVALPQIGEDLTTARFGILEAQSYVYSGYLFALASLLVLAGALTDFYGRRRGFAIGLVGFAAASILCGLAFSMEALIVFRILQGAADAFLVPGSLAIITAAFDEEQQGRAFGIWAGASAVTTILGPLAGGVLVDLASWRAAFFINIPLLALALWATLRRVDESRGENASGRFDWVGAAIVATAVGGLGFGAIRGQESQWQDAAALISIGLGVVALVAMPIWIVRSPPSSGAAFLVPFSELHGRECCDALDLWGDVRGLLFRAALLAGRARLQRSSRRHCTRLFDGSDRFVLAAVREAGRHSRRKMVHDGGFGGHGCRAVVVHEDPGRCPQPGRWIWGPRRAWFPLRASSLTCYRRWPSSAWER